MNFDILADHQTVYRLHGDGSVGDISVDHERARRWQRAMRNFELVQEEMEAFYLGDDTSYDD